MTTLDQVNKETNPSNPAVADRATFKRIPMSVPRQKLAVPDIPGFVAYWHLESNVPAAIQAGYEMVKATELNVPQFNVATSHSKSGNMDMGTNISMMGNKPSADNGGVVEMLYLMKIKKEWFLEDQRLIEQKNANILGGIFRGEKIMDERGEDNAPDKSLRYVDKDRSGMAKPLFNRGARKGSTTT